MGEELQLPFWTQAATEGLRHVLEVPRGIQGFDVAPKAVAGVEDGGHSCIFQRFNVPDDAKVLVMTVEVPNDAIAGEHLGKEGFNVFQSKTLKTLDKKLVIVL